MLMIKAFYERHFLAMDLVGSMIIAAAVVVSFEYWFGTEMPANWLSSIRQSLYTTIITISISLVGFLIAGVSIILVFGQMPRMKLLKDSKQIHTVFSIYFKSIFWLAITALGSFVGLLVDSESAPFLPVAYVVMWLSTVSIIRVWRCIWVLKVLTRLSIM